MRFVKTTHVKAQHGIIWVHTVEDIFEEKIGLLPPILALLLVVAIVIGDWAVQLRITI